MNRATCQEETIEPVTLEVAATRTAGTVWYQARVTLGGIVFQNIGEPELTELAAFGKLTDALHRAAARLD